jgi:membrane fusion protein (multidrug efflux system)
MECFNRILVLALLVSMTACGQKSGTGTPPPAPAVNVTATTLQPQAWSDEIEALGTAKANESVTLTAKITDTVRRVNFTDGQIVDAGDVLVEMSAGQQAAALLEAQANYKEANRQFTRNQDLVKQGTVSRSAFDAAEAARDSNSARVGAIRAQLADRVVTAPFGGMLGLRQVSPGALVTPGTVITTLDDVSIIKLDFSVPETFLGVLASGQEVAAHSAAWPEKEFRGRITSIDSRVDPVTRSVIVRAEIPNDERMLRPGMLLTVRVYRPARQVIALPEIALTQVGDNAFVYRVRPDATVEQVRVGIGARHRGEVEIVDGLAAGDKVVVEGTVKLRSGAKVQVVDAAPPAATTAAAR